MLYFIETSLTPRPLKGGVVDFNLSGIRKNNSPFRGQGHQQLPLSGGGGLNEVSS